MTLFDTAVAYYVVHIVFILLQIRVVLRTKFPRINCYLVIILNCKPCVWVLNYWVPLITLSLSVFTSRNKLYITRVIIIILYVSVQVGTPSWIKQLLLLPLRQNDDCTSDKVTQSPRCPLRLVAATVRELGTDYSASRYNTCIYSRVPSTYLPCVSVARDAPGWMSPTPFVCHFNPRMSKRYQQPVVFLHRFIYYRNGNISEVLSCDCGSLFIQFLDSRHL